MGQKKQKKVSEEEALVQAEAQLKAIQEARDKESESKVKDEIIKKEDENDKETQEQKNTQAKEQNEKKKEKAEQLNQKDEKSSKSKKEKPKKSKPKKQKARSKKYQEKTNLVDKNKQYSIGEAIDLVKKTSYTSFDSTVEIHIKLVAQKKGEDGLRGLVQLPHSTGKEPKVGILDESLIEKIQKDKKTEFDILLGSPDMMPKIAKVAKILGPQGKMPSPKSGTITADPKKIMAEIKSGRIEYKTDKQGIIHQVIGKVSYDNSKLKENFESLVSALPVGKLKSITICATMGPGIKVQF